MTINNFFYNQKIKEKIVQNYSDLSQRLKNPKPLKDKSIPQTPVYTGALVTVEHDQLSSFFQKESESVFLFHLTLQREVFHLNPFPFSSFSHHAAETLLDTQL